MIRLVRENGQVGIMTVYVNKGMNSYTRRHFASEVGERAIPTSTIEGCYPMLIHQRECHSYYCDVHYYVIICLSHCILIG